MACICSPYLPKYALKTPLSTWGKISAIPLTSSSFGVVKGELVAGIEDFPILAPSSDALSWGVDVFIRESPVSRLARPLTISVLDRSRLAEGGGVYEPILGPLGPIGAEMEGCTRGAASPFESMLPCGEVDRGSEIAKPLTSFFAAGPGGPRETLSFFPPLLPICEKNPPFFEAPLATDCID